jgi:hypothetical protein
MTPEEQKDRAPIKSLRTYQGDVEEAISRNKYSDTTIFVAEQKRRTDHPEKTVEVKYSPRRDKLFIYLGGIFFILGLGAIAIVYYIRYTEKVVIEQQTKTLLSFSAEKDLMIAGETRESLLEKIKNEKENFNLPINSVLYLNTTDGKNPVSMEKILSLLGPSQPPSLSRSFDTDYMIGVYAFDTNEVFLILKVKDFASSYSGMLHWEKDMPKDLAKIFSIDDGLLSTSSSFVDEALKNKDLRIFKDSSNKTQLLYSFIDQETLIITKNENIFNAIIGRYSINKQAK